MLVADDPRLAVGVLRVGGVHDRHRVVDRPHHREADEVGEGHLPAAGATEVAVDHPAVDLEELGRDAPEAGGGGDLEAGLHVGDDAGGGAPDRLAHRLGRRASAAAAAGAAGRRRERPARPASAGGPARRHGLRGGVAPVVGEEVLPALAHRRRVGEVLLVHLVDEPGVRAERVREQLVVGSGVVSHGPERTGAGIHHSAAGGG